jgi:DNA-binding transcriptional LysR family regulator
VFEQAATCSYAYQYVQYIFTIDPMPRRYQMELRHLRYFVAVGEEQHYGRAARRLRVAQPALSRQIQDLEGELGFKLFERLPRGVKLNAASKLFLEDAQRILQEINEATVRAGRMASGRMGTLRIGFAENASWRGVVPDSFRQFRELQPDAELQLQPSPSLEQLEGIRSGRLDAGFVNFMPKADPELDRFVVAIRRIELAVPKRHPLTKLKKLRPRDLTDEPFVWFPRRGNPAFYDHLIHECYRGGLKSPRIVQEGLNEATILSLASTGLGVGWVFGTARWRCPETVVVLPVVDLDMPLPLALAWRRDNKTSLLANFVEKVRHLPEVRAVNAG